MIPLLLLKVHAGKSQDLPIITGEANIQTLTEEDGYPGHNYSIFQKSPSGKIYTVTYNGTLGVTGSSYNKKIELPNQINGGIGNFIFKNENTTWYYNEKGVSILSDDTVSRVIPSPLSTPYHYALASGSIYYFQSQKNDLYYTCFNGINFSSPKKIDSFNIDLRHHFILDNKKQLWTFSISNNSLILKKWDETQANFQFNISHKTKFPLFIIGITDNSNFIGFNLNDFKIYGVKNGVVYPTQYYATCGPPNSICTEYHIYPLAVSRKQNNVSHIINLNTLDTSLLNFTTQPPVTKIIEDKKTNSYYGFTNNKPLRIISHLKKFPNILNGAGSDIFAITEDTDGKIWAASYKGGIAVIRNDSLIRISAGDIAFLNGATTLNEYQYFIGETKQIGLLQYDKSGQSKELTPGILGFSAYVTRNKKYFYYGTANYSGLWFTQAKYLIAGKPVWNKVDSTKGFSIHNIITITEDSTGRIWAGHPKRGISIYDPSAQKAQTWLIDKKETNFGTYSSICDSNGTVWLGSEKRGLWYYNDYKLPASPNSCKLIVHPLLDQNTSITALSIYKNWLVIGATDRVLLLNLDSFHISGKKIIRYLNPKDANFTGITEQNTFLTSKKENAVWFSTSDMLYKWSIEEWLRLPTYKVEVTPFICAGSKKWKMDIQPVTFKPGFNSFDIKVQYQSPDNLPRFLKTLLIKDTDTTILATASLQTLFSLRNLEAGKYIFAVIVSESDGSTSTYKYQIIIKKYLWQQWWFWALVSGLVIIISAFFINSKRKRQLAEFKAKTVAAELKSLKDQQDKELANLRLKSLSSQFRPHFILNALNTIGAQMDDKPDAETVLSRLGESVNLIFTHAIEQKTLHSLQNEWTLLINIIKIHQLMYLKKLEILLPEKIKIDKYASLQLPMGALQIPVENALLHGLSNRTQPPWELKIQLNEMESGIEFSVTDTGIGRIKSMQLSNFTKHGTGTKNLQETIKIINDVNKDHITITYKDEPFSKGEEKYGTSVIIFIPYNLKYEL